MTESVTLRVAKLFFRSLFIKEILSNIQNIRYGESSSSKVIITIIYPNSFATVIDNNYSVAEMLTVESI